MIETNKFRELIESVDKATETLKELNEQLKKELDKSRYTDEEKQNFIDCVRAYCLVHNIKARLFENALDHICISYFYMDERPVETLDHLECYTTVCWGAFDSLPDTLNHTLGHIHNTVIKRILWP